MAKAMQQIKRLENCAAPVLPSEVFTSVKPLLLPRFLDHWPITQAGKASPQQAADYLSQFDKNRPLTVYEGEPQHRGRIFYDDDFTGFNFARTRQTLSQVLEKIFAVSDLIEPPSYYVGSTMVDHWLPGLRDDNDLDLEGREHLMSLWLGNRSRIAAHYDFPDNIACCLVGRRRVILFPPEQADNLYIGPLDFTPSGQPISLVDSCEPDLQRFPKYADAMQAAYVVELNPGDALFIPSMWFHHIEALDPFNVLVNYWWRSTPAFLGSPLNALSHAVMSLRSLPAEQRKTWQAIFNQYVFEADAHNLDHIPDHALGMLAEIDEASAHKIRTQLQKFLKF